MTLPSSPPSDSWKRVPTRTRVLDWSREVGVAVVLFLVAFASFAATAPEGLELADEGHLMEMSSRAAAGEIPHRDTIDVYGPGVFAVTGLALRAGDNRVMAVRRTLAAIRAGAVVVAYLLSRYLVPTPFALLTAAISLIYWGRISWNLNVPYAALYTVPLCLVSCLLLLEALRRDSGRWFFCTGLVAGLAVLFKQSLGIVNVFYLIVAIWAARTLNDTRSDVSKTHLWLTTAGAALLAAVFGMLPFLRYLNRQDYVLHFAPIHLLLALVALSALIRAEAPNLRPLIFRSFLPFGAGVFAVLAPVAGLYVYWGSLDRLVYDMLVLPTQLQNYYAAVLPPPRPLTYTVLAIAAICSAGMLALARRPLAATAAACVGAVLLFAARIRFGPSGFETWSPPVWGQILDMLFGSVQLFAMICVALLASASVILRPPRGSEARTGTAVLVTLLLLQQVFAFQIFPRDACNKFLIQGAIAPLFGYVLWKWYSSILGDTESAARRAIGLVLVLLLPVWMVGDVARRTVSALQTSVRYPIDLDVAEGLGLSSSGPAYAHITEFVELVKYIQRTTTPETRLLLMTNEEMILFASDRRTAVPEGLFYYFLAGTGMMSDDAQRPMAPGSVAARLESETNEVLVIDPGDAASAKIRTYDPELAEYVDSHFEVVDVIGDYKILKRKSAGAKRDALGS